MIIKKRFSINNIYAKTVLKEYSTSHEFYTQLLQLEFWGIAESFPVFVRVETFYKKGAFCKL